MGRLCVLAKSGQEDFEAREGEAPAEPILENWIFLVGYWILGCGQRSRQDLCGKKSAKQSNPRPCYDERHPLNAAQSAVWDNRIMALGRECFGAIASEGGYDFCAANTDYVLYVTFDDYTLENKNMIDRIVPLWQIVYHGIILSNPFTKTTNYTIKDKLARVKLAEFGGRPHFYVDSKFVTTKRNWMGDEDINCNTDEALASAVKAIKAGADDYKRRQHLQMEFMEKHEMLTPDVSRTLYSDGSEIITNEGDKEYSYKGYSIQPLDYVVVRKQ